LYHVLHIDDEEGFLELSKIFLQKESIKATSALSGEEGLRILKQKNFDAIISDFQMPGMNGLEFLDHLRTNGNDIPFIMLTGKGREEVAIKALNLGADHYLMKGGDNKSLFSELAHVIQKTISFKLTETQLNEVKGALEQSMDVLEKTFEEVENRSSELEEFIFSLSHELINPFSIIKGFLALMQQDMSIGNIESLNHYISRINATTTSIEKRIEALFKFMQLKRDQNPPEWVSINDLVEKIIETSVGSNKDELILKIDPHLPKVYGDRIQLQLLIENLLKNSLKFSQNQQKPLIEIGFHIDKKERLFYIRDNGIGIDPSNLDSIFKLFERLNPEITGTGIGLTIAKHIVEAHGGKIWAESPGLGHGSTFYFTFAEESQTSRFKVFEEGMQVNGTTIMAIIHGMGAFARLAKIFFRRVGLTENIVPDTDHWYSQQQWLDVFRLVSEKVGEKILFEIGKSIPENAQFPPDINDIEVALQSIDIAYHMNHRNKEGKVLYDPSRHKDEVMLEGIGHYEYEKTLGEKKALIICENPYPCDFDRGIITAMAQRFEMKATVVHNESNSCRKKGANSCTYIVKW